MNELTDSPTLIIFGCFLSGLILLLLFLRLFHLISRDLSRHREQHQRMEKAWTELSSLTGLSFNPGDKTSLNKNSRQPHITGILRGRGISLNKVFIAIYHSVDDIPGLFTEIKISVNNTGCSSLCVKEAGFLAKSFRKNVIVSGDEEFDRLFTVAGSPDLFVRRALALIVSQKSYFLNRLPGTILLTDDPIISETIWKRSSIELKGPELVCHQHGILTDTQKQIAFLNLLCDLAELAEQ